MARNVFEMFAKLSVDTTSFENGISGVKNSLDGFSGFVGKVFKEATSFVTDFVKSSIAVGAEFDKSISQVAATMGTTADQVQQLNEFAKELGSTTAFSAQQAAEGLNYMALAGYDAEKSMEMLPKVLDLAAAGCMDLGRASDMVTDASSALQLDTEQTTDLIDQMAKAAASSNTSVSQLGEAILQVGGTAKDLAGGTVELTSILGILADNGMKGAQGGTALRNMLNSLISPTKDAQEVLDRFGISLFDSQGEMRGMNEVFADLGHALDGLTTQDRKQAIAALFNARDMKAAEALMANATTRYEQLSKKIMDSEGAAAEMAETQLDNLAGDVTIFKSGLEGLQLAISDSISPFLRDFVQGATSAIGDAKKLIENLTGAFSANGARGFLTMVGLEIETVRSRVQRFVDNILPTVTEKIEDLLSHAPEFILNLLTRMTNPDAQRPMVEAIKGLFDSIVNGLFSEESLNGFFENLPNLIGNLIDNSVTILGAIGDIAGNLLSKFVDWFIGPDSDEHLLTMLDAGAQILDKLFDGIKNEFGNLYDAFMSFAGDIAEVLGIGEYWEEGKKSMDEFFAGMKSEFPNIREWASNLGSALFTDDKQLLYQMSPDVGWTYDQWLANGGYEAALEEEQRRAEQERQNRRSSPTIVDDYHGVNGMSGSVNMNQVGFTAASGVAAAVQMARLNAGTLTTTPMTYADPEDVLTGYALDAYRRSRGYATGFDALHPTWLNNVRVAEKGEEVLLPLDSNTGWMDKLADRLGSRMNGVIIQFGDIVVHGSEDVGNKVVGQLDTALRQYQVMQQRGIGGVGWA